MSARVTGMDATTPVLFFLRMDRTFDSIRSETRFVALARKIGLGS